VVKGKKGSFVSLPQRRDKQGRFRDVAFPKTAELRKKINSAVLKQYKKLAA
jgi:stage V sporulation protein G